MMRSALFVITAFISAHLLMSTSCNKHKDPPQSNCDGVACTMMFAMVGVQVTDATGQPVMLDEAYTLEMPTGKKIEIEQHMGNGNYNILDDSYVKQLQNRTAEFRFIGMKNGVKVVDEPYRISADCCHVKKESGKATVTIN